MSDFLFSEAIEEDGSLVDESEDDIEMVSDNDFIDDAEINESGKVIMLLLMLIETMLMLFMILFLILILIKN